MQVLKVVRLMKHKFRYKIRMQRKVTLAKRSHI
jgi:hypothetical protein